MSIARKNGTGASDRITVPCNNCPSCLARRRSGWAFRLQQHLNDSTTGHFITLTYNDNHLPVVYGENDQAIPTLEKSDLTLFLKRLRYFLGSGGTTPLKYYAVGEYGTKTHRPHYHVLFFNLPKDKRHLIDRAWQKDNLPLGNTYTGSVNERSINYVAGYIINKRWDSNTRLIPPFSHMSKGLGASYITKFKEWHQETGNHSAVLAGGAKIALPRYYASKIFNPLERERNADRIRAELEAKEIHEMAECSLRGENYIQRKEIFKQQYKQRMINKSLKNKDL